MNPIDMSGATFCSTSGLLTATGSEALYDTTVAIWYCIDGKAYVKATVADGTAITTDAVTSAVFNTMTANQGCILLWCLNAAGTVSIIQGPIVALSGGAFIVAPEFPSVPDTLCPFAYMVAKAGATAGTITIGTSNWDATGFTNAIQNIYTLPNRPQIA